MEMILYIYRVIELSYIFRYIPSGEYYLWSLSIDCKAKAFSTAKAFISLSKKQKISLPCRAQDEKAPAHPARV
jgi:hypothetical protein